MSDEGDRQPLRENHGTTPLAIAASMRESNRRINEHHEALWGGPHGPGLVHTVQKLADTTRAHQVLLVGNGREGLEGKVRRHERFVDGMQDDRKWLIRALVAQVILMLVGGGWVIIRLAAGAL